MIIFTAINLWLRDAKLKVMPMVVNNKGFYQPDKSISTNIKYMYIVEELFIYPRENIKLHVWDN
jgi:hypothetical protein